MGSPWERRNSKNQECSLCFCGGCRDTNAVHTNVKSVAAIGKLCVRKASAICKVGSSLYSGRNMLSTRQFTIKALGRMYDTASLETSVLYPPSIVAAQSRVAYDHFGAPVDGCLQLFHRCLFIQQLQVCELPVGAKVCMPRS